jgi:diguanylate cyclase (GGDEF)-like protein/PAS domain S-box-containing protein
VAYNHLRRRLLAAVLLAVLAVTGTVIERARESLDDHRRAELALYELKGEVSDLWRADEQALRSSRAARRFDRELSRWSARTDGDLAHLSNLPVDAAAVARIRAQKQSLTADLREQADALVGRQPGWGVALADHYVAPRMRRLNAMLTRAVAGEGRRAERASNVARAVTLGTLGAGALAIALLFVMLDRAARVLGAARGERRLRSLVHHSSDLVTVLDRDLVIREQTDAVEHVLGHAPDALVGTPFADLVHPDDRRHVLAQYGRLVDSHLAVRYRLRHADGSWRDVESVSTNLLDDPDVRGVVLNVRDISDRARLEAKLREMAFVDPLTGLANRARLLAETDRALAADGQAAIVFADLDDFKAINDGLGHPAGDEVLAEIGRRVAEAVGDAGVPARLGGDEFALLVPGAGADDAITVARDVLSALELPIELGDSEVRSGASAGVAVGESGTTALDLLRNADVAMYRAKERRSGVELYRPEDDLHTPERVALASDLRRALARGEELTIDVQPQVDVRSGELLAVEALVRWGHPQHGRLAPGAFVELAERNGLMGPLTERVLGLALEALAGWREAGIGLRVSVNLSAPNLLDATFPATVARLLSDHGAAGADLVLELTETMLLSDTDRAAAILAELSELGVELAIDDFGTGHSSLTRVRTLPLAELKIDRSFVGTFADDKQAEAIVRSTINLGHDLGLRIVAEGVEDAETLSHLAALGCDVAQGWHVARPMPPADLPDWLDERGSRALAAA